MIIKPLQNQRGVALVVTLAIVAVLLITATQVSKIVKNSVTKSHKEKDRFYAQQIAMSGIQFASLILIQDAQKNSIDSVQEPWADPLWLENAVGELGYKQDALSIKISDELSKIQVNALLLEFPGNEINPSQLRIWDKFFRLLLLNNEALEQKDPIRFTNCLKDWMDSNDDDAITGISGAESDYYLGLDSPYTCTNGPFNYVDELFSVKGITKELLIGNENNELDIPLPDVALDDTITVLGLDDTFESESKYRYLGKVNINTAPMNVIAALLPEGMEEFAQDMVDFRLQKGEQEIEFINALDKGWYKRVIDLPDDLKSQFEDTIGYASHLFRVECTAVEKSEKVVLVAFLKRERHKTSRKWSCKTIRVERKY